MLMILRMDVNLGVTPSQYSSGEKSNPGRITKVGDSYLRTLLVQGARSVLIGAEKRADSYSPWPVVGHL